MTTNKKIAVACGLLAIALAVTAIVVGVAGYYRENTLGPAGERIAQTLHHTGLYSASLGVIAICLAVLSGVAGGREARGVKKNH